MRLRAALAAIILLVLTGAAPAPEKAEKRIALVIGISAYQNAPTLANPVNDARAIGEALRRLNFEVFELFDPDYRQFSRGLRDFGVHVQGADTAVIYYAGHGVQADHENYLLPADAKLEHQHDLLFEASTARWSPGCRDAPSDGKAREAPACVKRVLRGGSFRAGHDDITAASRSSCDASVRYIVNGFRETRDLD